MRIILLTRYTVRGASSRLRFFQYLSCMEENGMTVSVSPLLDDTYLERIYSRGKIPFLNVFSAYIKRFYILLGVKRYDLLIIEKELFPWLPPWAERILSLLKVPFIVDYDDAIFHNYDMHKNRIIRYCLGEKIRLVMKYSSMVLAGNEYLVKYAKSTDVKRIHLLPTVIDLNKYSIKHQKQPNIFTIGWIGTPSTSKFLNIVLPVLNRFCSKFPAKVLLIGSGPVDFDGIPVEIREWSETTEVSDIHLFDVGIMPLYDEPWEQGKCGYKLIQYMACGLPVITSPVGINNEIVQNGMNGFFASNDEEWMESLRILYCDPELRMKFGEVGRKKVELKYSLQVTAPLVIKLIQDAAKIN